MIEHWQKPSGLPGRVVIREVGLRDGLQITPTA
jgi:hypothetical protein